MTREEKSQFIEHVSLVISQEQANEDYPYFKRFATECTRYDLSEEAFKLQVLAPAFMNYDGPLEPTSGPHCVLFGTRCYSLRKMGDLLFNFPARSEEYLSDAVLFREDVRKLENSDTTMELVAVLNSESQAERRYLRLMYHLNPGLPFRIGNETAGTLNLLLQKGFENYQFYGRIVAQFVNGNLRLWLEETEPEIASIISADSSYSDFLRFLYRFDSSLPFYIAGESFPSPLSLAARVVADPSFWDVLYEQLRNGHLAIWFNAKGRNDLDQKFELLKSQLTDDSRYEKNEKKATVVQALICDMNKQIKPPSVFSDVPSLALTSIEASAPVEQTISFKIGNPGYLKVFLMMDKQIAGVQFSSDAFLLNSFEGKTSINISLKIDPAFLVKDQIYALSLTVETINERFEIPIEIKAVFPKQAFTAGVIKFGVYGLLFFALIRLVLMGLLSSGEWMQRSAAPMSDLPREYPVFIVALGCTIAGLYFPWKYLAKQKDHDK
ncbi:hypothetical protein INP83_10850 [Mucilaginibacter sp. 21P]|uniref:hypothetical protein n=1 Tax=Mucilaginibacter sp. 21P TaxID=2778902 RepID=UPI001C569858|nr:hypothetical protein [Mucilaginibacter sp. 21P]QXV63616.1 hypothetical protein INP83_10850 [Mucilaginibacter sp. 21P]